MEFSILESQVKDYGAYIPTNIEIEELLRIPILQIFSHLIKDNIGKQ